MEATKKKRFDFYILSGEGDGPGTWQLRHTTDLGVKQILARARHGGGWAKAYCLARGAGSIGVNIESGSAYDISTAVSALHFS